MYVKYFKDNPHPSFYFDNEPRARKLLGSIKAASAM
jgi:hypothetical protein